MKKAFTMLELIFVIIVIGILAAVILPEMRFSKTREAAIQLVSHIRYTQHLAMIDDKFGDNTGGSNWYEKRWQIRFSGTNNRDYSIVSNNNTKFAADPLNHDANLTKELENQTLAFNNGCANHTIISFDHLGRPIVGALNNTSAYFTDGNPATSVAGELMTTACRISLTGDETNVVIVIEPETGYAYIDI